MGLDAQHLAQLEASLPYVQQKKNGAATTAPGNVNLAGTTSVDVALSTPNGIRKVSPEMAAALYAPLPPEAISPHPSKPYLSSIKNIFMIDRLNQVFGIGAWTFRAEVIENDPAKKMIIVKVTLLIEEYGIMLEQFGGHENEDRGDSYKGAITDALSKIGSYLGIGINVYMGGGPTKQNPRPQPMAVAPRPVPAPVARPKQPAPWTKMSEMRAQFARIRERVGEVVYLAALFKYGVGTDLVWKNTAKASASENALACFEELLEGAVQ